VILFKNSYYSLRKIVKVKGKAYSIIGITTYSMEILISFARKLLVVNKIK